MQKHNTLTNRTIVYSISKILSQGVNTISAFIFVRLLTTEEYGQVTVYTAWVSLVSMLISLRTDGTVQIAKTKYGKEKLDAYCSCALTLFVLVFCAGLLGILFLAAGYGTVFSMPVWYAVLILIHSFGSACLNFRSAYYTATKEAVKDLAVSVMISVLSLGSAALLVLIMPVNKHIGRMGGFAFANFLPGAIFFILMLKKGKCFFDREYCRLCLKLCFPLIFSGLSTVIISQADRLMLDKMVGAEATAIYSFGYNVMLPISVIWYSLNHAWIPEYHEMMQENRMDEIGNHSRNYRFVFTCLSCGYLLVANEVLQIMGTEDYLGAQIILPLIGFYYYLQFLYSFPVNFEFYMGNTKLIGVATTLAAGINILLNYFCIPRFGMVGALTASLAAEFFMFMFHDFNARRVLKNYHYDFSFYLQGVVPFMIVGMITYIFADNVVVRWGLGIVTGIMLAAHLYRKKAVI